MCVFWKRIFVSLLVFISGCGSLSNAVRSPQTAAPLIMVAEAEAIPDTRIDGVIGPEWADATILTTSFGRNSRREAEMVGGIVLDRKLCTIERAYLKHDGQYLYAAMAIRVHAQLSLTKISAYVYGDVVPGGIFAEGDNLIEMWGTGISHRIDVAYAPWYMSEKEVKGAIPNGIAASLLTDSSHSDVYEVYNKPPEFKTYTVEFKSPLASGDRAGMDWQLAAGDRMSVLLGAIFDETELMVPCTIHLR